MFDTLGLLTRFRLAKSRLDLDKAAKNQFLFPLAGAIIGTIAFAISILLYELLGGLLDGILIAVIIVIVYYFITGIIHIEGLSDFCDGLMTSGDFDRKRSAMKDVSLGAAGVFSMILAVILLILLINEVSRHSFSTFIPLMIEGMPALVGLIIAEISAKLSMLATIYLGPSSHDGMGSIFVSKSNPKTLLAGILIALIIAFILTGLLFPVVLVGLIVAVIVVLIARKNFGGVSGDAFGAANEIGRIVTLLAWVIIL